MENLIFAYFSQNDDQLFSGRQEFNQWIELIEQIQSSGAFSHLANKATVVQTQQPSVKAKPPKVNKKRCLIYYQVMSLDQTHAHKPDLALPLPFM